MERCCSRGDRTIWCQSDCVKLWQWHFFSFFPNQPLTLIFLSPRFKELLLLIPLLEHAATQYNGAQLLPSAEGLHNVVMLPIIRVALISGVGQVLQGHDIYCHAD